MLKAPLLHMEFVDAIATNVLKLPQRKISNHILNKQANKQINNDLLIGFSIFYQRKNGEMDKESLSLSEQVLAANPDFSTLWNFRREIFLHNRDEK